VLIFLILFIVALTSLTVGDKKSYSYKAQDAIQIGILISALLTIFSLVLFVWYVAAGQYEKSKVLKERYSEIIILFMTTIIFVLTISMAIISICSFVYLQKDPNFNQNKKSYYICLSCAILALIPIGFALTLVIYTSLFKKKK